MTIDTPVGPLSISVDETRRLQSIHFGASETSSNGDCAHVIAQLQEYFAGKRKTFELDLAPRGTPFQLAVWNELMKIGYGETITYAELAQRIGKPNAVRAVGAANGANPIPLIVPCHRVIGSNGTLTGYGGGIDRKQWLLAHEGRRLF
ncbi:MAG TPA: methylated-DNA--[protein]-cysteine S-methyltransferase [Thermoanaerobaculia bacterium]|nr:methylated-DNA--[protein]-cysteine S-methyltransferase [Thermoanaerobaculia bacterium]